ncbi:MAG: heparinase II/III family protein [bacterium]|nr:heparinase II/III family protein [bacterium]
MEVPRHAERRAGLPTGFQARLRSAFLTRGWTRAPEPRVRFGQPFLPGLAALGAEHRGVAGEILARANDAVALRFRHLGEERVFAGRIDWAVRDASDAWRAALHRLDEGLAMALAAAMAESPAERTQWWEAASAHVGDWMARGRGAGGAADVGAQARRIANLIHVHAVFANELRADANRRRALLDALYAEAVALAVAVPRLGPDQGLVPAGRALIMAGRFFDGMEAREWLEAGTNLLWGLLREQVADDGGVRGGSPARHAQVLGDFLDVLALMRASNDDVPPWGRKRVKAMADFLARILHPDGSLPLGDGTPAEMARPAFELLAIAAVVLHDAAFAAPGELPGVWPLLVLGESGRRAWNAFVREETVAEPRGLRRTGLYVLPGGARDLMVVDGRGAAEGRAAFGYELSVGGLPLVVGPGCGADVTHVLAAHARSPQAQNVLVGGPAPVRCESPPATSVVWAVRDGLVYFGATDDSGERLRHRRHVFCLPGRFWVVCDQLLGSGEWDGESLVHLHPQTLVRAECAGKPAFIAGRNETCWVTMTFAGARDVRLTTATMEPQPQGWHAPAVGEFEPAPTIALSVAGSLPLVAGYALMPRGRTNAELEFTHDAFELRGRLRVERSEYLFTVVQDEVEFTSRRL